MTPKGYSTVCPFLLVESVELQLEFLVTVFNAEIKEDIKQTDGFIGHAKARIGEVVIMMGRASEVYPARRGMNYVYVNDPDDAYRKAVAQGAVTVAAPVDQPYGNRSRAFTDSHGNEWWVARPL
jgi:PhnB protein